jgi:hypothetical protein
MGRGNMAPCLVKIKWGLYIRMCIESCWKMGLGGKGVRESTRRG